MPLTLEFPSLFLYCGGGFYYDFNELVIFSSIYLCLCECKWERERKGGWGCQWKTEKDKEYLETGVQVVVKCLTWELCVCVCIHLWEHGHCERRRAHVQARGQPGGSFFIFYLVGDRVPLLFFPWLYQANWLWVSAGNSLYLPYPCRKTKIQNAPASNQVFMWIWTQALMFVQWVFLLFTHLHSSFSSLRVELENRFMGAESNARRVDVTYPAL